MTARPRASTVSAPAANPERTSRAPGIRSSASTAAWRAAPEVSTPFHVGGLDGVRAIAVTLVILFHLSPGAMIGGYLGVDMFFVVSGFLITSLLLREHADTGRVALGAFWARRARRLLPALVILLLLCCSAAALIGGDLLVGLGMQVLGAGTFSSNWLFLADGSSYFGEAMPELFRNLWSLAVEEQFYLVWPLLLALVLLRISRPVRIALVAALAVASAVAMAVFWSAADSTRVYYGTDTHAFGLALGAVLALLAASWPKRALEWPRAVRLVLGFVGPAALLGLLALAALMPGDAEFVFRGGLALVAVLSVVVIASLLVPGGALARVLELGAFRWVGRRSYGLYLWHWPVFLLVTNALPGWAREGVSGWAIGGIALAITVPLATLSYRLVEQPIRRLGFREVARRIRAGWRATAPRVAGALATVILLSAGTAGTAVALSSDPGIGSTQAEVEAGQHAIRDATVPSTPAPSSNGTRPTPPPAPAGDQITAIGDSVMLAAAPQLQTSLPGIAIDAVVSRHLGAAPGILQADLGAGTLRPIVVIGLATNGPIERTTLDQVRAIVGPRRELVVVNVQAPRGWTDGNNRILSDFAQSYRNVELANWHDAAQPILGDLNRDQIHFGPTGARVFTESIQAALQRLAELPPLRDPSSDLSLPTPF
ncbi:acyltransferase family protein [Lysinimonas soli]|uniref:Acyltransferase family protein n=1 Tax=Lysinimonas soli TaxID=1074233 RepID=A0ABW0NRW0_9MICO